MVPAPIHSLMQSSVKERMEWWHWVADIINISGNLTIEKEDSKEHIELLYEDLWKHYID